MATAVEPFVDYYAILSLPETAQEEQIREALRAQRRTWIKRQAHADPKTRQRAEDRVRHLDEAETTLLDPGKRRRYDEERKSQGPATAPTPTEGVRDWLQEAQQFLDLGNPASANYAAREAINQRGSDDAAWYVRAHSSFLLGNWRDADYEFNEAIRIKPDNSDYHFDLGSVYEAANQWNDALRKYEDALKLQPGNPMYKTAVASVYLNNGQPEKALPIMQDVIRTDPDVEAFQFYYSAALYDYTLAQWATLRDGSHVIINPAQIDLTMRNMEKIRGLKLTDPEVKKHVDEAMRLANEAGQTQWLRPGSFGPWLVGFAIAIGITIFTKGIGIIAVLALGVIYYLMYRKPAWKITEQVTRGLRTSNGISAPPAGSATLPTRT